MDTCNACPLYQEGRESNSNYGSPKSSQLSSGKNKKLPSKDHSQLARMNFCIEKARSHQSATNGQNLQLPSPHSSHSPNKLHSTDHFERLKLLQQALNRCGGQRSQNGNQRSKQSFQQGQPLSGGKSPRRCSLNDVEQGMNGFQKRGQNPPGNEKQFRRICEPKPTDEATAQNKLSPQPSQDNPVKFTEEQIPGNDSRVFISQGTPTIIEVHSPKHIESKPPISNCEADLADSDYCNEETTDFDCKSNLGAGEDSPVICDCFLPEDNNNKNIEVSQEGNSEFFDPCKICTDINEKDCFDSSNPYDVVPQNSFARQSNYGCPQRPSFDDGKKDMCPNLTQVHEEKDFFSGKPNSCNEPAVNYQPPLNQPNMVESPAAFTHCVTQKPSPHLANRPSCENRQQPETVSTNKTIQVANTDTIVITPGETTVIEVRSLKDKLEACQSDTMPKITSPLSCDMRVYKTTENNYNNQPDLNNNYNCTAEPLAQNFQQNRNLERANDKQRRSLNRKRPSDKSCFRRTCSTRIERPMGNCNDEVFYQPDYDMRESIQPQYNPQQLRQYQQYNPLPEQYSAMFPSPQITIESVYSSPPVGSPPVMYQQPYQPSPISTLYSSNQCQDRQYYQPQAYQSLQPSTFQWNQPPDMYQNGQRYQQYPMAPPPTTPPQPPLTTSAQYRRCAYNENGRAPYNQDQGRNDSYPSAPQPSERNDYVNQCPGNIDDHLVNDYICYDYDALNNMPLNYNVEC